MTKIDECFNNILLIQQSFGDQSVEIHSKISILSITTILILIALFIKLGVAPFDRATIDTYDGVPTAIISIFAVLGKFFNFIILIFYCHLINDLYEALYNNSTFNITFLERETSIWNIMDYKLYNRTFNSIILSCALISLFVGSIAVLHQTSIQRFLAYSSVSNVGFILLGIATGDPQGITAAVIYSIVYIIATLCIFTVLSFVAVRQDRIVTIYDCLRLYKIEPVLGIIFVINFLSYGGIPPLGGFYAKFYVLSSLINNQYYITWWLTILLSTITVYYYIYLISLIYFQPSESVHVGADSENLTYISSQDSTNHGSSIILYILTFTILVFPFLADIVWFLIDELI